MPPPHSYLSILIYNSKIWTLWPDAPFLIDDQGHYIHSLTADHCLLASLSLSLKDSSTSNYTKSKSILQYLNVCPKSKVCTKSKVYTSENSFNEGLPFCGSRISNCTFVHTKLILYHIKYIYSGHIWHCTTLQPLKFINSCIIHHFLLTEAPKTPLT